MQRFGIGQKDIKNSEICLLSDNWKYLDGLFDFEGMQQENLSLCCKGLSQRLCESAEKRKHRPLEVHKQAAINKH